jgi:hypothetical protein
MIVFFQLGLTVSAILGSHSATQPDIYILKNVTIGQIIGTGTKQKNCDLTQFV